MRASRSLNTSLGCSSAVQSPAGSAVANNLPGPGAVPVAAAGPPAPVRFAALDFETADYGRDSACALSIVTVDNDAIVDLWTTLIRPPRRDFVFTYLHGITWEDVKKQPSFGEVWGDIARRLEGTSFVAAHNASFDRGVLQACCEMAAVQPLKSTFACTVRLARAIWGFYPANLAHVCRQLRIPLRHHDAESDARACAQIILAARERGHAYDHVLRTCALRSSWREC